MKTAAFGAGAILTEPAQKLLSQLGGKGQAQFKAPELAISLSAEPGQAQIKPGELTNVSNFTGNVLRGRMDAIEPAPSYFGPTFRMRQGEDLSVFFTNRLSEESIVHWHGLYVSHDADGHPEDAVGPGALYPYHFRVWNRAGTYWYHPHPHMITAPQVHDGLAGLFIVHDDEEDSLDLPSGELDVPIVIQDRTLSSSNQFIYIPNSSRGFLGQEILVNGQADFELSAKTRIYRLRLLNGSNSRFYKLAWDDGSPFTVIGTDGGLLERPVQKPYLSMVPGERIDIWLDLSQMSVGEEKLLKSLAFDGLMFNVPEGPESYKNGAPFDIMRIRIAEEENEHRNLPDKLSAPNFHRIEDAVNRDKPRNFRLNWDDVFGWQLDGLSYDGENVAPKEIVQANTLEVWEFYNEPGPRTMAHPMHLHGQQYYVIERECDPMFWSGWYQQRDGLTDEGWKDTILVMPGERVRFLVRFDQFTGLFLYHCHNLEHEDMGMMRNYRVSAS